jgi:hypothetical protein
MEIPRGGAVRFSEERRPVRLRLRSYWMRETGVGVQGQRSAIRNRLESGGDQGASLLGECTNLGICVSFIHMRTTVTLSDEAAELVKAYAESAGVSLSRSVSDLIERGSRRKARIKLVNGIPVFDIPGGRRVTTAEAKRLEVDER